MNRTVRIYVLESDDKESDETNVEIWENSS